MAFIPAVLLQFRVTCFELALISPIKPPSSVRKPTKHKNPRPNLKYAPGCRGGAVAARSNLEGHGGAVHLATALPILLGWPSEPKFRFCCFCQLRVRFAGVLQQVACCFRSMLGPRVFGKCHWDHVGVVSVNISSQGTDTSACMVVANNIHHGSPDGQAWQAQSS